MALDNKTLQKIAAISEEIKNKRGFSREDIQKALDLLAQKELSLEDKKSIIAEMIKKSGIAVKGLKTVYRPREELEEVDKTFDFLKDIKSYKDWDK